MEMEDPITKNDTDVIISLLKSTFSPGSIDPEKLAKLNSLLTNTMTASKEENYSVNNADLDQIVDAHVPPAKKIPLKKAIPVEIPKTATSVYPVITKPDIAHGQSFVEIKITDDTYLRLFLNEDPSLPDGTFLYDYFGTGEIYYNSMGREIFSAKKDLRMMYVKNFMEDSPLRTQPSMPGQIGGSVAVSHQVTGSKSMGWLFSLDTYFKLGEVVQSAPQVVASQTVPICAWYSDPERDILSEHYQFGNHVPGVKSCCNPSITGPNTVLYCGWSNDNNQIACSAYQPRTDIVTKIQIKSNTTPVATEFVVESFSSLEGDSVYKINNITSNSVVQQIVVPSHVSPQEAIQEVNEILDSYVACYTDHQVSSVPKDETVTTSPRGESFIKSLLKV